MSKESFLRLMGLLQGCPMSMVILAGLMAAYIRRVKEAAPDTKHGVFVDDQFLFIHYDTVCHTFTTFSFIRYGYQILLSIQFSGKYYTCDNPPEGQSVCSVSDLHSLLQHDPNDNVLPQVLALLGFLCLYRTLGYLVLVYRSPK